MVTSGCGKQMWSILTMTGISRMYKHELHNNKELPSLLGLCKEKRLVAEEVKALKVRRQSLLSQAVKLCEVCVFTR